MLGLFAGERENDVLMHLLPLARLLSELVQCRWVGVKALEQCPGAGRVTWLCSGPWETAQRPPPPVYGVKGGGLYSITRLHGQLHLKPRWPLSAPRQAFVLVPSA